MQQQIVKADDPILEAEFFQELVKLIRAEDTYGTWDGKSPAELLDPFVLTKERRKTLPIVGDPDSATVMRIRAFYETIATQVEKECGHLAVTLLHLHQEGFGRVLITVGKLVVLDRTLRDMHRFGFESLSKMKDEADNILAVAMNLVGSYSEVAGL